MQCEIIEDYFLPESVYCLEPSMGFFKDEDYDVLMERGCHICNVDKRFVPNFKLLYNVNNPILFDPKNFNFQIISDMNSSQVLHNFMKLIAEYP